MATLLVHVVPGAKQDAVVGEHGGAVKIKIRARPVEDKANTALCEFIARRLNLPRRSVVMQRGPRSRNKLIEIAGMTDAEARRRLLNSG
jgi:uncharacterized protein